MALKKFAFKVFPNEVWDLLAEKLEPSSFIALKLVFPELEDAVKISTCVQLLFPAVFKVLYDEAFIGFEDGGMMAKICRSTCNKWRCGVDGYFQDTNFDSVENIHGVKNGSAFVLRMPLQVPDINRIYELDLHPRCVSFGNKLSLEMEFEHSGYRSYPDHVGELKDLVRTVKSFWERFEHLEIKPRQPGRYNFTEFWQLRESRMESRRNHDLEIVPLGDTGVEIIDIVSNMEKVERTSYMDGGQCAIYDPNRFNMYIPFLHLMTNLKTVTIRVLDRCLIAPVLLRIPRTKQLVRVVFDNTLNFKPHSSWFFVVNSVYSKCCDNISFLAGCQIRSLETLATSNYQQDLGAPSTALSRRVFQNLEELQLTTSEYHECDFSTIKRLGSNGSLAHMFPSVKIIGFNVNFENVHSDEIAGNFWKILYTFVSQFPALEQFSLTGFCIPTLCVGVQKVSKYSSSAIPTTGPESQVRVGCSKVSTFKFQCPAHVPKDLLLMFPALRHVIVEERDIKCNRYVSKCSNWQYIRGFFDMFPLVSRLTFTGTKYNRQIGFGPVTRDRADKRCCRRRKMKQDTSKNRSNDNI